MTKSSSVENSSSTVLKPLDQLYGRSFFSGRSRLQWRALYIVEALMRTFGPKSVIDVGCAVGENIAQFVKRGVEAYGIEGSPAVTDYLLVPPWRVLIHDLRLPLEELPWDWQPIDLVISYEVAEHIEPEHADMFVNNLKFLSDRILMTAAPPGQEGRNHFNCQPKEYWEEKMKPYVRKQCKEEMYQSFLWNVKDKKEVRALYGNVMYYEKK